MELTSKQRAQLRGMANELQPIVHIGKDGIGENLIKQANDALEARELIKCKVLENSMMTAREACDELSKATRSEQVQVIGTKFVLYRQSHKKVTYGYTNSGGHKRRPANSSAILSRRSIYWVDSGAPSSAQNRGRCRMM